MIVKPQQLTEGIVIPVEQQNYNPLLQHMHPNTLMVNGGNSSYSPQSPSFNASQTPNTVNPRYSNPPTILMPCTLIALNTSCYDACLQRILYWRKKTAPTRHIFCPQR
eukprot:165166_1